MGAVLQRLLSAPSARQSATFATPTKRGRKCDPSRSLATSCFQYAASALTTAGMLGVPSPVAMS